MPNVPQYFFPSLGEFLKILALLSQDLFWVYKAKEGLRARVGPHGDMSPVTFMAFKMFGDVIPVTNWRQAAVKIGLPQSIAEQVENPQDERVFNRLLCATGLAQPAPAPQPVANVPVTA